MTDKELVAEIEKTKKAYEAALQAALDGGLDINGLELLSSTSLHSRGRPGLPYYRITRQYT